MDTNIRPIDTRHEAIKAAANKLAEFGCTRDVDTCNLHQSEVAAVARAMILRYVDLGDTSSAFEFLTEASAATDEGFLRKFADVILGGSSEQTAFAQAEDLYNTLRSIDDVSESARQKRLALEKLVKARNQTRPEDQAV